MNRKRRLQWIAWVMAFCMILTGMPSNAMLVQASGNEAKETEQIEDVESIIIEEPQSRQVAPAEKSDDGSFQFRVCYDNKGYDSAGAPKACRIWYDRGI